MFDRCVGVIWHTQASGKSLSMLFYADCIIEEPALENPTLVFLTDRNNLDDQLFGQFQRCHEILRQTPVQADSVEHLRKLLNVASGGVVLTPARPRLVGLRPALCAVYVGRSRPSSFTTIQKFMPEEKGGKAPLLSERRNIVVIADEAHRSQYDLIDGRARNLRDSLPHASFIGLTPSRPRSVGLRPALCAVYVGRRPPSSIHCIKLKTKWAALESLVEESEALPIISTSSTKSQSHEVASIRQACRRARKDRGLSSQSDGGSKARFFGQYGFDIAAWEALAQALREHGRTYEIARERQTGFGPRFIVEGDLNTPSGQRPRVRTVWQLDGGTIAPRLMTAYPLEAQS